MKLLMALLITLSGCAKQKLTQSECLVAHESGFVDTTGNQQHITVAENGSPCVIGMTLRGRIAPGGQIGTPPVHGTDSIRDLATATLISYTPARDYVGDDRFEVVFSRDFNTTVLVQVVPLKSESDARR
jgi:hypothetical protein